MSSTSKYDPLDMSFSAIENARLPGHDTAPAPAVAPLVEQTPVERLQAELRSSRPGQAPARVQLNLRVDPATKSALHAGWHRSVGSCPSPGALLDALVERHLPDLIADLEAKAVSAAA